MIIADTSGLLAAVDADEACHEVCKAVVLDAAEPVVLSPFVLGELDYLLRRKRGVAVELAILADVAAGAYRLATMTAADVASARTVVERYRDLDIGLADASIVVLADRFRTADVFTLDVRHFRAMRPIDGDTFRLLPADR
ncbi:MAG TPA: PIN domain-containing protein [Acidimicrobiia bacterium]